MLLGMGTDIASVARIEKLMSKRYGNAFVERVFTEHEISYCSRMSNSAPYYAARWALKEAFYKALPEEIQPIASWHSIELVRDENSKPYISVLDDKICAALDKKGKWQVHQSISHEREFCVATVFIELHAQ